MVKRIHSLLRQILVLVIGVPVTLVGIILIPLPGPGVLITLLGLFILSFEFDFADDWLTSAKQKIKTIYDNSMERYHERLDEIDKR